MYGLIDGELCQVNRAFDDDSVRRDLYADTKSMDPSLLTRSSPGLTQDICCNILCK